MTPPAFKVLNFVLFQVGWFACVLGAAGGYAWVGPSCALAFLLLHLAWADRPGTELRMIFLVALLGVVVDTTQTWIGALAFGGAGSVDPGLQFGLMPLWMVALWVLFASTLNCSLQWMQGHYLLALILGAIAGPCCFLAGAGFGALQLNESTWFSIASNAVSWGLVMPAVFWVATKVCRTPKA